TPSLRKNIRITEFVKLGPWRGADGRLIKREGNSSLSYPKLTYSIYPYPTAARTGTSPYKKANPLTIVDENCYFRSAPLESNFICTTWNATLKTERKK